MNRWLMLPITRELEMTMQLGRTVSLTRLALAFSAFAIFAGCASTPDIYSNRDPSADFGKYHTFNFEDELGTDRPGSGATSLISQYLVSATTREMEARGYQLADDPDLMINFFIYSQEKIRTTQTPTTGGYYGYRGGRYSTWGGYGGYETQVTQYTEGTLNVDLIEMERDQLVWEGTMVGRMGDDVLDNLEQKANEAMGTLFTDYPYAAGSNVPQVTDKK